jgi:hypothetical protein
MRGLLVALAISLIPLSNGVPASLVLLKDAPSEYVSSFCQFKFTSSYPILTAHLLLLDFSNSQSAMCLDGSPPGYYFRQGTYE